ncbi:hypothetical protein B6A10_16165, partial [Flavobacterium sp. L1I52]|nr:hypothetical protein [Flavobacterium pokkalii]
MDPYGLEEVVVYGYCHPLSEDYDSCECDGIDCPDDFFDSGNCHDPMSNAYPCEDIDDYNCTNPSSSTYPCDTNDPCDPDSSAYDICECDLY